MKAEPRGQNRERCESPTFNYPGFQRIFVSVISILMVNEARSAERKK